MKLKNPLPLIEDNIRNIGENVDKLISLDIAGRNLINILYPPTRERTGYPLCMLAAKKLKEVLQHKDYVLITSGMLIYPFNNVGETDGPLGAASLGRALMLGFGAKVIIITDDAQIKITTAACRGAGLNVVDLETLAKTDRTISINAFPVDEKESVNMAKTMFNDLSLKAVIAIERRGRNEKGVYHALPRGRNMNHIEAKTVALFDEARSRNVLTIGIGDGGNETGWGIVNDVIRERIPFGDKCSGGCGGGFGDVTTVDVLIAASVSNWGAYGVEACLSILLDNFTLLHDIETESRMLRECIDAGAIDGSTFMTERTVDGIPEEVHFAVLRILLEMIQPKFQYPKYVS